MTFIPRWHFLPDDDEKERTMMHKDDNNACMMSKSKLWLYTLGSSECFSVFVLYSYCARSRGLEKCTRFVTCWCIHISAAKPIFIIVFSSSSIVLIETSCTANNERAWVIISSRTVNIGRRKRSLTRNKTLTLANKVIKDRGCCILHCITSYHVCVYMTLTP